VQVSNCYIDYYLKLCTGLIVSRSNGLALHRWLQSQACGTKDNTQDYIVLKRVDDETN